MQFANRHFRLASAFCSSLVVHQDLCVSAHPNNIGWLSGFMRIYCTCVEYEMNPSNLFAGSLNNLNLFIYAVRETNIKLVVYTCKTCYEYQFDQAS